MGVEIFPLFLFQAIKTRQIFSKTRPRSNYRPHHLYNYLALAATSCRSVFFFINWMLNSGGMGKRNPGLLDYPLPLLDSLSISAKMRLNNTEQLCSTFRLNSFFWLILISGYSKIRI